MMMTEIAQTSGWKQLESRLLFLRPVPCPETHPSLFFVGFGASTVLGDQEYPDSTC